MNRILNWFRLRRLEGDLDRELQYHIDRRVTDLIHSGLPEPEARRRAALELGGATQLREEVRDIWLSRWLRDFMQRSRVRVLSSLPYSSGSNDLRVRSLPLVIFPAAFAVRTR
jgi:hypothetical protein